ncbi:MAG: S1C family serine protease [Bacillota bacterium]
MKRLLGLTTLLFLITTLAGCSMQFDEIFEDDEPESVNVNEYTEQELREIIEELMPESYEDTSYNLETFEEDATDMMDTRRDSVVGIQVNGQSISQGGSGSGVVYKKDGNTFYVVTNEHVIEDYDTLQIMYEKNGMLFDVADSNIEVLGMDETTDLAVLTFESEDNFYAAEFADSYEIEVGQFAFAVGNPLGFDYFGTLTMGVVSGLSRYVQESDMEVPFIQHDASIAPGNSGGALFDINGDLIGINNMKIVEEGAGNIGFAIPSNTVQRIVQDLEENGEVERPFLGISAAAQVSECGQDSGVCLSSVEPDGAADEAGLQVDDIVTGYQLEGWDEFEEVSNFNDLRELILNSSVGDRVRLEYTRDDETYETDYVELKIHPEDQ